MQLGQLPERIENRSKFSPDQEMMTRLWILGSNTGPLALMHL